MPELNYQLGWMLNELPCLHDPWVQEWVYLEIYLTRLSLEKNRLMTAKKILSAQRKFLMSFITLSSLLSPWSSKECLLLILDDFC